ncbi:class I SAM-dependent methyltransferase [Isoptericola croceus]|uniref:class I SAM-dependent methyltransferase n=1 Tax=Isoptericola croceus TaxID=3031406 RepID=UPI0023F9DB22|nr:class I SAM-dependent methyltransferase [Isoptericola croceus]
MFGTLVCMSNIGEAEAAYWDRWNADHREHKREEISLDQARVVLQRIERLGRRDLRILEVGCGAGWFVDSLVQYGSVTGVDLSPTVLERARHRVPEATFIVGDLMAVDLPSGSFDIVVGLEVLSHVEDQERFFSRVADLLDDGGRLILATQNRDVLERMSDIPPAHKDARRRWLSAAELRLLAEREFAVEMLRSITPRADQGLRHVLATPRIRRALRHVHPRVAQVWAWPQERAGWGWTLMLDARKLEA